MSKIYDKIYKNPRYSINYVYQTNLIDRYRTSLRLNKEILDIACGTGTHIFEFNKKGYNCKGIDISKTMIKKATIKNRLYNTKFICKDFNSFETKNKYDIVICLFNSLPEIIKSNKYTNSVFKKINKIINKDGLFIFDFFKPNNHSNQISINKRKLNHETIYSIRDSEVKKSRIYSEYICLTKNYKDYKIYILKLERANIKKWDSIIKKNNFKIIRKGNLFQKGTIVYILKKIK